MSFDKSLSNNILIRLLKTISADEWKEFEKFAGSPYFNDGRNYIPLLKILRKFHPDFDSENFNRQYIYKKLFPGKKLKDSVLSSMLSRLYRIGEEYLIHNAIKKNKSMLKEKLIIEELRSRGIMLKLEKQVESNLEYFHSKKFDTSDFKSMYNILNELYYLHQVNNKSEIFYSSMTELIKYTLYSFFQEINIELSSIYSLKNYWKDDFSNSYLSEIYSAIDFDMVLEIMKREDYKNYLPLKLSYLSFMATKFPENDNYYFELKELFIKESDNFADSFREIIMNNLSAISSQKVVAGLENFRQESFEIKKMLLQENLMVQNDNFIKVGDFRSMFLDALNIGETGWAVDFSENYLNYIHPDFRKSASEYCKAWIAFGKKEFDKAIEHANKVSINQITFRLDMKNITARIYYETNSYEPLISILNSYFQLIRNSVSKNKDYLNRHRYFIKYLRKLASLRDEKIDFSELKLLKKNIESNNVNGKSWLLKKIDELIKSSKK